MTDLIDAHAIDTTKIFDYIQSATRDVFQTMLDLEVHFGEPRVDTDSPAVSSQGILALVGFAGTWVGTGSISCSTELACLMCSRMLMVDHHAINEDVLDAVAEVTNMVLGNVKTHLEEHLGPMGLSVPTVVFGRNFYTRSLRRQQWSVVPVTSDSEKFEVRVCLLSNDGENPSARNNHPRPFGVHV